LFALPGVAVPFLGGPEARFSAVARFTAAGLDTTFGDQGAKHLDQGVAFNETSTAIALQPDGKILAADTDLFRLIGQ
jgi:hypothetical protein